MSQQHHTIEPKKVMRWDIFCNVIDNYGDIGVTWRLARQLVAEYQQQVQLWVDDLTALAKMAPGTDLSADRQYLEGICIRHWHTDWADAPVADVVIEAFACTLPEPYIQAMCASASPCVWLNLEYLSAEAWVEDCHGLPSKLPNRLEKYFFFPGFSEKTGGLLREANLLETRNAFRQSLAARTAFLNQLGIAPPQNALLISLFSYENPQLADWLQMLSTHPNPVYLLVPEGRILGDIKRWLQVPSLSAGEQHQRGNLTLRILPFSTQDNYDHLLWRCDFNIVRGEDSFVRAQWAGKPMLWHIYPQDDNAHLTKLEAFLDRYTENLSGSANKALRDLWLNWNRHGKLAQSWAVALEHWPEIQAAANHWCEKQANHKNISQQIVTFAQERLICARSI